MKPMRLLLLLVLLFAVSSLVAGCYGPHHRGMGAKGGCCKMMAAKGGPCGDKPSMVGADTQAGESQRAEVLYSCNCGPGCKCNSQSKAPGNCSCGTPLKQQ